MGLCYLSTLIEDLMCIRMCVTALYKGATPMTTVFITRSVSVAVLQIVFSRTSTTTASWVSSLIPVLR